MKRRNEKQEVRRHFTLIELLVVIAIIAILAGMLLPALKNARDKANVVTCTGNLKTMSSSIMLYADEYSGWFGPINRNASSGRVYPYIWVNQLYVSKYIAGKNRDGKFHAETSTHTDDKYTSVLACPFAIYGEPLKTGWRLGSPSFASGDYGFNYYASEVVFNGNNGFHRLSAIKNPSSRLVLADANNHVITSNKYPTVTGNYVVMFRHNGLANVMAGDGSIQSTRQTKFKIAENFR